MYVCVCNAVTEDDVRGCVMAGACSTREVRAACGMQPGCGACTKPLRTLVNESLASSPWLYPAAPDPDAEPAVEWVGSHPDGPGSPAEMPLPAMARDGLLGQLEVAETANTRPAEHAA
jgi:bacterioferritin-associated ferredoxin